jgi:uncharacterized protein with WD repeat
MNLQPEWVFGINAQPQNVKYICSTGCKAANEHILYSVGKVVVIYFPNLNAQHYYQQHRYSISVIEISKGQRLVASAEEGEYPEIHIWDLTSKLTLCKFKQLHKEAVEFLRFFKNDRQLVTTSRSPASPHPQTPIIILNLETQEIIMSTYLSTSIIGLACNNEFQVKCSDLLVVSPQELAIFSQQRDSYQISSQKVKTNEPIQAFAYSPKGNLLTCHKGRKLYFWDDKLSCKSIDF